jgi:hypothetical protein
MLKCSDKNSPKACIYWLSGCFLGVISMEAAGIESIFICVVVLKKQSPD